MPCSEKGIAILAAILGIVNRTKPIFKHGQEIEKSNPYMKFGRNQVISWSVPKCKSAGGNHLEYPLLLA